MEVGLAVGGAFLSSALNVFFDRMTPKFPDLFRGRERDELLLRKLKATLLAIHAVLEDAEDKQISNRHVEEWLSEVKRTVYDAEDLVDEINTEALRLEVEAGERSMTDAVSHLSDEFLKEIIPRIEEVVSILEYFVSQINVLGLERGRVIKQDASPRLPSTSLVDESEVYGRDNEREELIHVVLNDNNGNGNNVRVIPIVGMGGLGKTTLAQLVYNDERVKEHFDEMAWVCVSENYDAFKITQTLVGKVVDGGFGEKVDLDMLQVKLKEGLMDKKFLIVLDDVWNNNYNDWDKLKAALKAGREGSVILVTTRNGNVAKMMQTRDIFYMDPVSHEDCWSLFKKQAFNNSHALVSPEFERIGEEIVKKCKGLPLAVKTVGGLLRFKTKVKEWDDILRSDFWSLDDKPNEILPVLRLSYHHLPPHLKQCFAFCALFPKNYTFDKEELVLLWMANDLLQRPTRDDKTIRCMEEIGSKYFSQLRSRSFFRKQSDGTYLMHDLVNDLARYVFGTFCVRYEDYQLCEIPREIRHFSYMSKHWDAFEKFKFLAWAKRLRTFFPISRGIYDPASQNHGRRLTKMFSTDILPGLGRLRVLSLCGYVIKELSDSLGNLKHLRYVNLSWTDIEQLPDSICNLHNLQTLLLSHCSFLDELPKDITKLVNLHHLDLKGTELRKMPSHMSKLKSLQTLSYFIVDNSPGRSIEELGKLSLCGYLKIKGLQNVTSCSDTLKANLREKNHLEELVFQWNGETDDSQMDRDILDQLQPNTNLRSLMIDGYGGTRFPNWVVDYSFCNIVSLCLINCRNCFILPTLGHLASLKFLTISGLHSITQIGEELYGDGSLIKPFESLVTLRIEQMLAWEEWDTPRYVDFSHLEEIYIIDCPKLIGKLPFGLSSLKTFQISGCPRLVFSLDLFSHLSSLQFLGITNMPNMKELADGLVSFPKVNKISLRDCPSLESLPVVVRSTNVRKLSIAYCQKLKFPTENSDDDFYGAVEHLRVAGTSFDDTTIGLFPKLQSLHIESCESLKVFPTPHGIQNLKLMHQLYIFDCKNLLSFPKGGLPAPSLEYLHVNGCKKLKSLPEQMHPLLPSLRKLYIVNCPKIESFPEGGLPFSLEYLTIWYCEKLVKRPSDWGLQRLPALRTFSIGNVLEESFPDKGLLPCCLSVLTIEDSEDLKTLNGNGLLHLISLGTLNISNCPNLQSLPGEGLPTSLSVLLIDECPMLKPHLEREKGKYWPQISHIPIILVDWELIS